TSLSNGPIHFNVFPNYPVSIQTDNLLDQVLKLHLQTTGLNMKPGSSPLAIFYRIIFHLTNTAHPAIKHGPSQGSSVVMHASLTAQKIEPEVTLQKAKSVLNRVNVSMDTKEASSSQNDNDFPVAKDFEIYTEDRKQRRQYWYQRQLDSKIEQSESARMMNWNNKATRAIQDQVLSQNEKLKRMQDTLKAIELHQRGDIHSAVSLLNKKVDSLSTNMQQLTTNLQHVPDQVSNSLQSQIQQSIHVVSEGSEKKVIDSIQTVNEK
ncbi:hypothetical protein KI387_027680, partial [Taxus chinensis]